MSSVVNMLKNALRISDPSKRHDRHLNLFDMNKKLPQKDCRSDFSSVWDRLTRLFQKSVLKQELSHVQVTTFFGINNCEDVKVLQIIFFSKCSKFYLDSKNAKKVPESVFGLEDNCIGTCYRNFSLLRQEYMSPEVNMLKDGPHILDPTNTHDTHMTLFDMNGNLA